MGNLLLTDLLLFLNFGKITGSKLEKCVLWACVRFVETRLLCQSIAIRCCTGKRDALIFVRLQHKKRFFFFCSVVRIQFLLLLVSLGCWELSKRVRHVEHRRRNFFPLYRPIFYPADVRLNRMKKSIKDAKIDIKIWKACRSSCPDV